MTDEINEIDDWSDLSKEEALSLIGKTVKGVSMGEYYLSLTFTDDTTVTASGHTYDGCALNIRLE